MILLVSCSAVPAASVTPTAPSTALPVTAAPQTEPPETEPPETTAPVTEPPEATAPATEPPETTAPVTEPPETETPTAAVTGGTLTMARQADFFTLDPFAIPDDPSIFVALMVYERLVRLADDGRSVEPELAEDWTVAPDELSVTFTLRDGVSFSDGSPLVAEDVAFSLNRIIDPEGSWGFLFAGVDSVTAVDPSTVRIDLTEPFSPLLSALSTFAASIYSKASFEAGGESGQNLRGTGAFMLDHWDKGTEAVFVRNPHYWRSGQPYLDGVTLQVVGDDNSRVLQLQGGAIDLIDFVPASQLEPIESSGGRIHRVDGTAVGWITLNHKEAPLGEASVRCALAWSVDRETIANNIYFGAATVAKSIMPSTTLYYDPDTEPIGFDLDRARALLAESSVPDGFELETHVASGDPERLAIAQLWADALAQLGITLRIEPLEATTFQEVYNLEQYQSRIAAWTNDTPDPDEVIGGFKAVGVFAGLNAWHTNYRSDEMNRLALEGALESDPEIRAQIYSGAQRLANQDCPIIYTVEVPRLYGSTAQVMGFDPNPQGKYNFENVWKQP
jgi:peptide/nickel transport system substrate-binding protein